uniref:Uncharacterized protein n=1 Tax=Otus sunia TaxID=257818 RepID=A0A8C8AJ27_9STRI
ILVLLALTLGMHLPFGTQNSWAQAIWQAQPPESLGLQAHATTPSIKVNRKEVVGITKERTTSD